MKAAITSLGTELDSRIDERFGRARYFVIVDTDSNEILDIIDNVDNQHATHGAGVQSAQSVLDAGVDWLLTGNVGPKAFSILTQGGIKVGTGATGTIRDAVEQLKSGGFDATEGPTSQGHMP
jgi:predicted Fe-Mo cluster-binding NifX family protein